MNAKPAKFPVVTRETLLAHAQSLKNSSDPNGNYNGDVLELMSVENPMLAEIVTDAANKAIQAQDNFKESITHMMSCLCSQYMLMRSQMEADEMNESFK